MHNLNISKKDVIYILSLIKMHYVYIDIFMKIYILKHCKIKKNLLHLFYIYKIYIY